MITAGYLAGHRVHGDLHLEMPRGRLIALLRLRKMSGTKKCDGHFTGTLETHLWRSGKT